MELDDSDGEPVTSCVVEPGEACSERRPPAPAGGNQRIAWTCMGELLRQAGDTRAAGAPAELPMGRPAVTLEAAAQAIGARLVCEDRRRRERAMEAIRGLCGRGLLHHAEGWLWCP